MSGSRNLMSWGPKVHEDILIAMSGVIQPGRKDWDIIMSALRDMGYTFTESALKQHLQKLKRKENGNTSGASAPTTPSKPKGGSKTTTPRSKKGKKRTLADEDDDDDDDIDEFKPVKKLKFERDSDIKEEDQEGDGEV